jgi:hypothetical protein
LGVEFASHPTPYPFVQNIPEKGLSPGPTHEIPAPAQSSSLKETSLGFGRGLFVFLDSSSILTKHPE